MTSFFSKNQLGVEYNVKLVDCIDDSTFNVENIIDQKMVFYKPDGTNFTKQATLVPDPDEPSDTLIQYFNTFPEESILDQIGNWRNAVFVKLNNSDTWQTVQTNIFKVR